MPTRSNPAAPVIPGYARLYAALADWQTGTGSLGPLLLALLPTYALIFAGAGLLAGQRAGLPAVHGAALLVVLGTAGLHLAAVFLLRALWAGLRHPAERAQRLAAYLLIAAPRPYSSPGAAPGLGRAGVLHLQRVAEHEQNASHWRGYLAGLPVALLGAASAASLALGLALWQQAGGLAWPAPPVTLPGVVSAATWGMAALLATWLVALLLARAFEYLGGEPANRAVLFACQEALAFLEDKQLTARDELTLREKRAVAEHFGCALVTSAPAAPPWRRPPVLARLPGPRGEAWLLICRV
jgi:hypothetical protein